MVQEEQREKWADETKRARHGRTGSREKKGGENESRDKDVARAKNRRRQLAFQAGRAQNRGGRV